MIRITHAFRKVREKDGAAGRRRITDSVVLFVPGQASNLLRKSRRIL
jgi:hypothetical protein